MSRWHRYLSRNARGMTVLLVLVLLVTACGPSAPSPDSVATEVARSVAATLAAQPTTAPSATPAPTETPQPTDIAAPTETAAPTNTPEPTDTRAPTRTPGPTNTRPPTRTPTPAPGIGEVIACGRDWTIRVKKPPLMGKTIRVNDPGGYASFRIEDAAKGSWLVVLFELTNMQTETDDLNYYEEELTVRGRLNGREVRFTPNTFGVSLVQEAAGISDWSDEVPPGITLTTIAVFDVNPSAEGLSLVLETDNCLARIPLVDNRPAPDEQAATEGAAQSAPSSDEPVVMVGAKNVNLRAGPSTAHPVVGQATANSRYPIVGRTADSSWWLITAAGKTAWVAGSVVTALGPVADVEVAQAIPTPPPVPTAPPPPPTAAPAALPKTVPFGQEFTTTLWGLKLYDVKRAKVVYFYGDAEIAHGTWLIPFVEVRNLGSGTARPSRNLSLYLQDERGRTFTFDTTGDGVLGAAWQFKAGHLYDDIHPGSVLGVALPFDVTPELGDMWLRVKEAPNVVIYLGNVSQMPESK